MDAEIVAQAIVDSTPRVEGVGEISASPNGLGTSVYAGLQLVGHEPLSAMDLQAILAAIVTSAGFDPNAVRLTARDAANESTAIDLEPAAEEIAPGSWIPFGDRGVSVVGSVLDRVGSDE